MDAGDKSVTREDQILISVSKSVDNVDNWTQGTNLNLGNIRIHISVSKAADIVDKLDANDKSVISEDQILISVSKTVDIVDNWTQRTNL